MPDISMCRNRTCPSRMQCYRYRAKPSEWRQSYAFFQPNPNGECDAFSGIWPDQSEDRLVPTADLP